MFLAKKWGIVCALLFLPALVVAKGAPSDPTIGGGQLYLYASATNRFTQGHFVVNTFAELVESLNAAQPGQVIFIPGSTQIDLSRMGNPLIIRDGITLASDRGRNGSEGALLYSNAKERQTPLFIVMGNNVRITGFRFRGPHEFIEEKYKSVGIQSLENTNLNIDNMEIYNWAFAGVRIDRGTISARVHHNSIHHNQRHGLGYGVAVYGNGNVVIHHNLFDANRHSIAGSGEPGQRYEAHSNIILTSGTGHAFDMHGYFSNGGPSNSPLAGQHINIHHNTFLLATPAVVIRGIPEQGARIAHNRFATTDQASTVIQKKFEVKLASYEGNFEVYGNIFDDNGDMLYTDFELTEGARQKLKNDVFWLMPASDSTSKTWYVSTDGTRPWRKLQSSGLDMDKIAVKDFDGDSVADVFTAGWSEWRLSMAGLTGWLVENYQSGTIADELLYADLDGDGRTDVIQRSTRGVSWGGVTPFDYSVINNEVDFNEEIYVTDLGYDGQEDFLRVKYGNIEVSWGGQTPYETIVQPNRPFIRASENVAHGDFNGDNRKDELRQINGYWEVRYFGASNFVYLSDAQDLTLNDIALGDFDGDGKSDLFKKDGSDWFFSSGGVGPWLRLGASGVPLSRLAFGDFNGDGFTDVMYKNHEDRWKISWSGRTGWTTINCSGVDFSLLLFSDFNHDGKTDVVTWQGSGTKISLGSSQAWKIWNGVRLP